MLRHLRFVTAVQGQLYTGRSTGDPGLVPAVDPLSTAISLSCAHQHLSSCSHARSLHHPCLLAWLPASSASSSPPVPPPLSNGPSLPTPSLGSCHMVLRFLLLWGYENSHEQSGVCSDQRKQEVFTVVKGERPLYIDCCRAAQISVDVQQTARSLT